jgi:ASC-1-like (ASCH) protein
LTFNSKLNKSIGAVTDGEYKIEVYILNFDEEEYNNLNLKKGDKIEFTALIHIIGKKFLFYNTFYFIIH